MSNTTIDGALLKESIKQAGYTLDEFFTELGVAKTTFYYYRKGVRPIPHRIRCRIEELLQRPFCDFLVPQQQTNLFVLPVEPHLRSNRR